MDILKLDRILPRAKYWLWLATILSCVIAPAIQAFQLVSSPTATRSGATALDGSNVAGNIYVFVDINTGIKSARFYIDGNLVQTEGAAPWDLAGTETNNNSKAYNTKTLTDGTHQISANLSLSNNTSQILTANVNVRNQVLVLNANPTSLSAALYSKTSVSRALILQTSNSSAQQITLLSDQPWLSFSNNSGPAPFSTNAILDASQLSDGNYTANITAKAAGFPDITIPVSLSLQPASANYGLLLSTNANRSNAVALNGQQVSGAIYVYLWPETNVKQVRFFIDNPSLSGNPFHVETGKPFDVAGTAADGKAVAFDTSSLSEGMHSINAELTFTDNSLGFSSGTFNLGLPQTFTASPQQPAFTITQPSTQAQLTLGVSYTNNASKMYNILSDQAWLKVEPGMNITPASHTLSVDASQLQPGNYTANLTILGDQTLVIPVTLTYKPLNATYALKVSTQANRSGSVLLAGSLLKDNVYIHVQPETNLRSVAFYLDRQASGNPDRLETTAPYDFAGTTTKNLALPYGTTLLNDGDHYMSAKITHTDGSSETLQSSFQVNNNPFNFVFTPSSLSASLRNDHAPVSYSLNLGVDTNSITPDFAITSNVPWASITPTGGQAPSDLQVTFIPSAMQAGDYQGFLTVTSAQLGSKTLQLNLRVTDNQPSLLTNPDSIAITYFPDSGIHTASFNLATNDDVHVIFTAASDQPWLTLASSSGTTPQAIGYSIDTQALTTGNHLAHITLSAAGYPNLQLGVSLTISNTDSCAPVICQQIRVNVPYLLEFDRDMGHVLDAAGLGTGFTYLMQSSNANLYTPTNIHLDTAAGVLRLQTTSGIPYLANNNHTNVLGIGFAGPNQIARITTQLNHPAKGTAKSEQAGLWFGVNEDNYVKLVYSSASPQPAIEFLSEKAGAVAKSFSKTVGDISSGKVQLELVANPGTGIVTASYSINSGTPVLLGSVSVDPDLFSFDAAGIDPLIGTRSFTGIMATHRNAPNPLTFEFEYFRIEAVPQDSSASPVSFTRSSYPLSYPTNMVWAPDGKLYVTELLGTIHALTYDTNLTVVSDTKITSLVDTLGQRLTLGITVHRDDPLDPNNYSLWISSSSPSMDHGLVNSSEITRLSGPGFTTVEHIITGLPRAISNHATNSIHFGPDNRLYIAAGGNTGAGAPVSVQTEFGDREEQPLAAALLVADVFAPNFDGSCANNLNIYGPAPCDVVPYVTGLRNSYDFTFHSNGEIYATDNGLGVTGAYPHSPIPDCSGLSNPAPVSQGGNNPGTQDDLLVRVIQGKSYGHPNPSRNECVFKDGHYQGVSAPSNYEPPMASPGRNASADGIIEYTSNRACGKLKGNLLISRYSLGDDILRVQLSPDGKTVLAQDTLVNGFNDPLTVTEHQGNLFVAELGGNQLTALKPLPLNCWVDAHTMPLAVMNAGSTVTSNRLYSIGGLTSNGLVRDTYGYDAVGNSWQKLADKPGAAVENPALASDGSAVYLMGGFSAPQSGARNEMWRYDIASDNWSAMPNLPGALGGASAQLINGKIYLAGGLDDTGASRTSLAIFDIASNSWSNGAAMTNARDLAASAVVGNKLYVFGGRQRLADGTVVSEAQTSVEIYNPSTDSWSNGTAMPRGRRDFAIGHINNRLQIIGGDNGNRLFNEVDEYNPGLNTWSQLDNTTTVRQGTSYGTLNNLVIISGGSDTSGVSPKNTTQTFTVN